MNSEIQLKQFSFPVQEREVFVEDYKGLVFPSSDYKAIVRQDNNQLISIARKTYKLVPNAEIIQKFTETLDNMDYRWIIDQSHSFVENNKMRLMVTFPELRFNDGRSDIAMSLYLSNSYDGSESVRLIWGAIRSICTNGMVIGKVLGQLKVKHTMGLDLDSLQTQLDNTYHQIPQIQSRIDQLLHTPVSTDFRETATEQLGKRVMKFVADQEESVRPVAHQWALFNILTYYVSHEIEQRYRAEYQITISRLFEL